MMFEELIEENNITMENLMGDLTTEQEEILLEDGLERWRESKEYKERLNG